MLIKEQVRLPPIRAEPVRYFGQAIYTAKYK